MAKKDVSKEVRDKVVEMVKNSIPKEVKEKAKQMLEESLKEKEIVEEEGEDFVFELDAVADRIENELEILDVQQDFVVDPLQQALIEKYCANDESFAQALFTDFTRLFFNFLRHKAQKNEPISISVMGIQRGGKSYASITLHAIMMLLRAKLPDSRFIVADKNDYLRALKMMPQGEVAATCFVVDEDKTAVYGTGSIARKQKIVDVQNIIAVNAISVIWIRPDEFSWSDAQYGLRVFGRFEAKYKNRQQWPEEAQQMYEIYIQKGGFMDEQEYEEIQKRNPILSGVPYKSYKGGKLAFEDFEYIEGERRDKSRMRLTRFMLYNLQESSKVGALPLGMVYLPPFNEMPGLFPAAKGKSYMEEFENQYMSKKMDWVAKERSGTRDVMYREKMRIAKKFSIDPQFNQCKTRPDRILYLSVRLGSEFTKNDCMEMERLAKKIVEGFWTEEDIKQIVGDDDEANS